MNRIVVIILLLVATALPAQTPQMQTIATFPACLSASSSLFFFNGHLWSANDHGRLTIYAIDTVSGLIVDSLSSVTPMAIDVEAIAQDNDYLYIADVGNNSGSRRDLRILRYAKLQVLSSEAPIIPDTIWFAYSDQQSFESASQQTDFDCEAVVATDTALLLFTKQWVSHQSVVYSLPKMPGRYSVSAVASIPVDGLVTGASFYATMQRLALCGYSQYLQPFVFVIDDFNISDLSGCSMQKYFFSDVILQTEAIATLDGQRYYISNEQFSLLGISDSARLRRVNIPLASTTATVAPSLQPLFKVYPNPALHTLNVEGVADGSVVYLLDMEGRIISAVDAEGSRCSFSLSALPSGTYIVSDGSRSVTFIHK